MLGQFFFINGGYWSKIEYLWHRNRTPMSHKRLFILLWFMIFTFSGLLAQESSSVFNFLSLSSSAHTTALGGQNISTVEDDASMIFTNPVALSNTSSHTLNLNYMNYMRGTHTGSAAYVQAQGTRGSWGVGTQFVSYGSVKETNEWGEVMGTMSPLDLNITGGYSYALSDRWVGGVMGKFLYSKYGSFSSVGLCVDLAANYYDEERDCSISAAVTNLGAQVKAFGETHERLPINLKLGFSKGLGRLPARITVTMFDINHWAHDYYFNSTGEEVGGFTIFMNHFALGLDVFPTKYIWLALGYNFRRAYEMKAGGSSHAAGLSLGAGVDIKRFKVGLAWSKQHVSTNSICVSLSYNFNKQ